MVEGGKRQKKRACYAKVEALPVFLSNSMVNTKLDSHSFDKVLIRKRLNTLRIFSWSGEGGISS